MSAKKVGRKINRYKKSWYENKAGIKIAGIKKSVLKCRHKKVGIKTSAYKSFSHRPKLLSLSANSGNNF